MTLELIEQAFADGDERTALILRLRAEKKDAFDKDYADGRRTGIGRAAHMNYAEFMYWSINDPNSISYSDAFADEFLGHVDSNEYSLLGHGDSFNREGYIAGFINGVKEVWNEVKDEL